MKVSLPSSIKDITATVKFLRMNSCWLCREEETEIDKIECKNILMSYLEYARK